MFGHLTFILSQCWEPGDILKSILGLDKAEDVIEGKTFKFSQVNDLVIPGRSAAWLKCK